MKYDFILQMFCSLRIMQLRNIQIIKYLYLLICLGIHLLRRDVFMLAYKCLQNNKW